MRTDVVTNGSAAPSFSLSAPETFSREKDVVGMYVDSAKTYASLSAGGLAVGAAFAEKLLQQTNWLNPNGWLAWASGLFMAALLLSAAYQYVAVARLERLSGLPIRRRMRLPNWLTDRSYVLCGGMIIAFLGGAFCLGALALNRLQ
jgi:hypothetical protein